MKNFQKLPNGLYLYYVPNADFYPALKANTFEVIADNDPYVTVIFKNSNINPSPYYAGKVKRRSKEYHLVLDNEDITYELLTWFDEYLPDVQVKKLRLDSICFRESDDVNIFIFPDKESFVLFNIQWNHLLK